MNYLLFLFWIFFMILFHYLIKNDFSFIQKYLNKLFKYSPLFKEYLKKYLKTILYTFFTFIVGKTFEHLDMWVDLFFVSIWMLVDEKENINIENFTNVFNYFKNNEENIIVECGGYDEEEYIFSIGKVEKVTEKYIEIKYFDYMAKWDEDEFDMVYYDDISVVSFGKRYIKYMSKYTH